MKLVPTSLGARLMAGSAVFTIVTLLFTLVLMHHVLTRFVTGQVDQRLDNKVLALGSQLRVSADGTIHIEGDADGPPFDKPRHKSFWFIAGPHNSLRTAWLRDGDFTPPDLADIGEVSPPNPRPDEAIAPPGEGHLQTVRLTGLGDVALHARVARRRIAGTDVSIVVVAPLSAIDDPIREAMTTIAIAMAGLGLLLLIASLLQVRLGLRPLTRLRMQVASVRDGTATTLPLTQPSEIMPLVIELNSLLEQNATNLVRARRHVANLAHGLKTPLATMALTLDRMRDADGAALGVLVGLIERRIRHHLGRARVAALDGPVRARTSLGPHLRDLVDALQKIHADRQLTVILECPSDLIAACEPQDVDEILGNLLENAFKYTRSVVRCIARADAGRALIEIADDGAGLSPDEIERVLRPGHRLDEQVPGFGFGLPIARELAELYAGALALTTTGSGLLVTLTLPRVR
jgi:signal transduction histidine kinase